MLEAATDKVDSDIGASFFGTLIRWIAQEEDFIEGGAELVITDRGEVAASAR
ncbi:hypothetical protein [Arthrobacter glacialis]|uniref:hypothetical protein n=1 Tax=Arthrobacter glacialis TaxID=1664 RepID=UPI0013FD6537|nr:hypothetical protein [Arthrobacter glacialis]